MLFRNSSHANTATPYTVGQSWLLANACVVKSVRRRFIEWLDRTSITGWP